MVIRDTIRKISKENQILRRWVNEEWTAFINLIKGDYHWFKAPSVSLFYGNAIDTSSCPALWLVGYLTANQIAERHKRADSDVKQTRTKYSEFVSSISFRTFQNDSIARLINPELKFWEAITQIAIVRRLLKDFFGRMTRSK